MNTAEKYLKARCGLTNAGQASGAACQGQTMCPHCKQLAETTLEAAGLAVRRAQLDWVEASSPKTV